MQALAQPTRSSTSHQALSRLCLGGVLLLGLLLVAGGLYLFSAPQAAFAQGATEILTTDSALKVVIAGASTDDPAGSADPGQLLDTGRCQARLNGGAALSLALYNGYPGYNCTLRVRLENRTRHSVRLEMLEFATPSGLFIHGPEYHGAPVLRAGEILEQDFTITVLPSAEQNQHYSFAIRETFAPYPKGN